MIPNIAEKIILFPDWAPIRKLMKDYGAEMVAGEVVVDTLKEYLDKMARDIVKKALKISKKITLDVIESVIKTNEIKDLECEECGKEILDRYHGGICKRCGRIGCNRRDCVGFDPYIELCLKCRKSEGISFECGICGFELIKGVDAETVTGTTTGEWLHKICFKEFNEEEEEFVMYDYYKFE